MSGSWPGPPAADGAVPAALPAAAARALGVRPGDALAVTDRLTGTTRRVVLTGTFEVAPRDARRWPDGDLLAAGRRAGGETVAYGPLVVDPAALAGERVEGRWRAEPGTAGLRAGDADAVAAALRALPAALPGAQVDAPLLDALDGVRRPLLAGRASTLVPAVQVALLALLALAHSARLVAEHRAGEAGLLRARGLSRAGWLGLAAREALLVAAPGALLAPPLAALLLRALGLREGAAPPAAWAVSLAVAVAGALVLVLPSAAQGAAAAPARVRPLLRPGGDAALLAVVALAGLALWQLERYGSPLASDGDGVRVDPLLVVAPALGLLAAALLALRAVPWAAGAWARRAARGPGLLPALAGWQVSRRPARYTGPALVLVLALSVGALAVVLSSSWRAAERDQADFAAGADVRAVAGTGQGDLRATARGAGASAVLPVLRRQERRAGGDRTLLAVDAAAAPAVVRLREDLAGAPLADLLAPLVAGRPQPPALALGGGGRLSAEVALRRSRTAAPPRSSLPPALAGPAGRTAAVEDAAVVSAVLRDADGLLARRPLGTVPVDGRARTVAAELPGGHDLLALEASYAVPQLVDAAAPPARLHLDLAGAALGGAPLDLGGWTARVVPAPGLSAAPEVLAARASGAAARVTALSGADDGRGRAVVLGLAPGPVAAPAPLPAVVTRALADGAGAGPGDLLDLGVPGARVQARVEHVVEALPTVDPGAYGGVLVDLPSYAVAVHAALAEVPGPTETWASAPAGGGAALAAALRADPQLAGGEVVERAALRAAYADDPVAVGVSGALLIAFACGLAFALVGLAVDAAVAVRERRAELAVLRALGTPPSALARLLAGEQVALVVVGTLLGVLLGTAVAALVVPAVTVAAGGTRPVPPVLVVAPWGPLALLAAGVGGALVLLVLAAAALARRSGAGGLR
ncbi:ABC transporter permease [Vallicoccus soli]|uniref:ABC transporter permease n=1 Tax=Vallicoccus soli TaxID=2339232 RepID=A0A3A3Z5Z3_9ACTN|nr:ABC transporter permease [Vallicoccus soli]